MKDWSDVCRIKTVEIDGKEVPSVSLGTSPFIGAGQFGSRSGEYYGRFYQQPENIERIIICAAELGVPAVQVLLYDRLVRAVLRAQASIGIKLFTTVTIGIVDWKRELSEATLIDPALCFIHARITDMRNRALLEEITEKIRKSGMVAGCATHEPHKTVPFIEESDLKIRCYLAPVNSKGYLLGPDPHKTLEAYESASVPVFAKKTLAAGRIAPEDAFSFVSEKQYIKGITVGIASEEEAKKTFDAAFRFWARER